MQEILSSIGKLKESFDALARPAMLPEPGKDALQPQVRSCRSQGAVSCVLEKGELCMLICC